MGALRAGFGCAEISPAAEARLAGYVDRTAPARGRHDALFARAAVLEAGGRRVAIAVLDLCYVGEDVVSSIRAAAAAVIDIEPAEIVVAATHTHSGPHDADEENWPGGLARRVATAIEAAAERLEPARLGAGWGMIHGHSLNRRRLEDPVDPALGVVRVDSLRGDPLGVLFSFGCHPVVLGPDNGLVSADWPGHASRALETRLGADAVAIFLQAGGADVNPLVAGVQRQIDVNAGPVETTTGSSYYGAATGRRWRVADRSGGAFSEIAALGDAVAAETVRVHRGIEPLAAVDLRSQRFLLALDSTSDAPPRLRHLIERPRTPATAPLEIALIALEGSGILIATQPGEVFASSAVRLRRELRRAGMPFPLTVSLANGWRGYLPPEAAFAEGGYEIDWARAVGVDEDLQERILSSAMEWVSTSSRAG